MRTMPLDIGPIHFVGIGGIGMSGIAEVMHTLGYNVRGSDQAESANVKRLTALGIPVAIGHSASNVADAEVLVISSAVVASNPEVVAARERFIPVVRRAEMLAELMRLKWCVAVGGTHGKTTTTSMIAAVLDAAQHDPTVINGGIINAYGTNARLGSGDWMVVEADESDGTFVRLPATIATVTNIDPEHLDFYGDFESLRAAFQTFIENIPFYGAAILCVDHAEVQAMVGQISDRKVVTYGLSAQADVRAVNLRPAKLGTDFDVVITDRASGSSDTIDNVHLPMPGRHNVQNALAAVAVARELGIDPVVMRRAFAEFAGVRRRFTKVGEASGVTVVDDYAHHPVEISAVLEAARAGYIGRVVAVVQPHRYSRLADLFDEFSRCFNDADTVIVADVFAAGEDPIDGINRDALVEALRTTGHRHALALSAPDQLADLLAGFVHSGDLVLCLGAGNITAWAQTLPLELAEAMGRNRQQEA
ncbi:MAG: UDP-N-acetylmuramate--L-alanine ligase [Alphaproteobacteria bacterium]|jgi:UDP-N-acetylmuramate--alanine ligase|nr:UDP-N-acetylmuramate--L-alanine ligase [Alphaproteobacteria bacterium]MBT4711082.1 UDP-N-acetylmuramate--L-alanine ligase [Alphaproteobacteria bacterium]